MILKTLNSFFPCSQADDELALFNEQMKDKKRNLFMLIIVYLAMTGMILLDAVSKYRSAQKGKEKKEKLEERKSTELIKTSFYQSSFSKMYFSHW